MNLAVLAQAPTRFSLDHAGVAGKWMEDSHGFFRVGPEGRDWQKLPQESLYVAVVADGSAMDGVVSNRATTQLTGTNASYLAVQTVERVMQQQPTAMPVLQRMGEAIRVTHQTILEASAANSSLRGISTSLIMAVVEGWRLYISHVGNSRAYLIRNKVAYRLTIDHLPVQIAFSGQRVASMETNLQIDHFILVPNGFTNGDQESEKRPTNTSLQLQPGDIVLLCSDGLTEKVSDEELSEVFQQQKPKQAVRQLVNKALEYRAEDNVTAAVLVLPKTGGNRWLSPRNIDMGALFVSAVLALLFLAVAVWSGVAISRGMAFATSPSVAILPAAHETPTAVANRAVVDTIASTATGFAILSPTTPPTSSPTKTLTQTPTNAPTSTTRPTFTTVPTRTSRLTSTPAPSARRTVVAVAAAENAESNVFAAILDSTRLVTQTVNIAHSNAVVPSTVTQPATVAAAATIATPPTSAESTVAIPTATPTTLELPAPALIQPMLPLPESAETGFAVFTTTQTVPLEIALAESPTATPFPSNAVAAVPAQPDLANFVITLMEPMESTLLGNTLFAWQPNFELPAKYAFELIFWHAGGDPIQNGFSPIGVNQTTSVRVNLNTAALGSLQGILLPEHNYEWSVALVDASQPGRRLKTLAPGHGFIFKIDEGSPKPVEPAPQPTSTPVPPPPTDTPLPPPTDTPLPPPTNTPEPPATDTPVPPPTDTPVPPPTEDCPRIDPNCGG